MQTNDEHKQQEQSWANEQLRASPSAFASLLTGTTAASNFPYSASFLQAYPAAKTFDFAEPSPDDIVIKAQNPKGRTQA
jgi:hypothetical protein